LLAFPWHILLFCFQAPNICVARDEEPPSPAKPNSPQVEEVADSMEGVKSASSPKASAGRSAHVERGAALESPQAGHRADKDPIEKTSVEHVSPEDPSIVAPEAMRKSGTD
jgi:hypothetical protein